MDLVPASPTKSRPRSQDTGFPAHFCGNRNTSLPHPEADLSGNAVITADDIPIGRLYSRNRRSFFEKHKRTISHGMITPGMERMYSDLGPFSENGSLASTTDMTKSSGQNGRESKDGVGSTAPTEGSGDESPIIPRDILEPISHPLSKAAYLHHPQPPSPRRRGLFSRWLHR